MSDYLKRPKRSYWQALDEARHKAYERNEYGYAGRLDDLMTIELNRTLITLPKIET